MKIRKLRILGFKSFMDKLEFTFSEGISGIVGPNGCGKSNVVDAIRWCMGEQSPKQLRGRQMDDVIFSGAVNYRPLGMAEVSMTFENGNGSFPPAYSQLSELSITRRLYRSGESDYLINNVPCRLKDIQEIFMDTGLGNKAYSIIGQGRIGAIVEQKPEDTRVMLEEAAGITKYRKKMEAAQKKIKGTEENLQRVEDIMGEVQRQMRSLKRQASKARRYKVLSEKIQSMELALYANSYHQLAMESGSKRRSFEEIMQTEMQKSTAFSRKQAFIETMNVDLEKKDRHLDEVRQEFAHKQDRVHRKEASLDTLSSELKMQQELEQRLNSEQGDIKNRLIGLSEEKLRLEKQMEETKEKAEALKNETILKEKRVQTKRQFVAQIKEVYEKARNNVNAGMNKELGLTHESDYLNRMLTQITDGRSRLQKELDDVESSFIAVHQASERKNRTREALATKLEQIQKNIEESKYQCEEFERIADRIENGLKSAESDLNACESRLASLQALSENFEGYKMGVRTIMKSTDLEPRQNGHILGLVADALQVDHKYEQAVESVLADKLQYIIVQSQDDGKQAVDYLKERAKGRSSFIPLDELNGDDKLKPEAPSFQKLKDAVTTSESFRPVLSTLLGDAVVAENLEAAISGWRDSQGQHCFVTLEGDMIDRTGVISGGKLARGSHGLLARKREIKELGDRRAALREKVNQSRVELDGISSQLVGKRQMVEALTDDRWACQEEINELDKKFFRLSQELDQMERLKQKIKEDMEKKDKEQNNHQTKLLHVKEALRQCKENRQEEEHHLKDKEMELRESEKELEQFKEELAELKGDFRLFEEEQRSLHREMERVGEYAEESKERLKIIEEDLSLGRLRRDEWRKKKEALKNDLEHLYLRMQEAETVVDREEQDRLDFVNRIKTEKRAAEDLRREIEDLKDEISRAKLEQSELQFKMNNLSEMVRDKHGMDLPAIYQQYVVNDFSVIESQASIEELRKRRQSFGDVNLTAIKEHEALKERYEFIKDQREDLILSIESLNKAITMINKTSLEKFEKTFFEVDKKLKQIFPILFNGGVAGLSLTDESKPLESGVLVEVRPPGKKLSHMGLLSGGEKALVAMALLFAIYMIRPSPFCLLDEVDAPLDDANIHRFNDLLSEIKRFSQIIMVTHNKKSMGIADRLFGITMENAGVSKIVSVDLSGKTEDTPSLRTVSAHG
jgi:chromosome segregation protein